MITTSEMTKIGRMIDAAEERSAKRQKIIIRLLLALVWSTRMMGAIQSYAKAAIAEAEDALK
jgi:hypothetical protein